MPLVIEPMQPDARGAMFEEYGLAMPVIFNRDLYMPHVTALRMYMTDREIAAFGLNVGQNGISIGWSDLMKLSFHEDDKWARMLIDFQTPMYEIAPSVAREFPTIQCSKWWFREFIKFYDDRHPLRYQYEPNFRVFINGAPIEIVERDGIWAQYQVGKYRVTSGGYDVKIEKVE